jgi:hypothetical protein
MGDAPDDNQILRNSRLRRHYPDACRALAEAVGADRADIEVLDYGNEQYKARVNDDPNIDYQPAASCRPRRTSSTPDATDSIPPLTASESAAET